MRILVLGAGALGSVVGGLLARSGHEVCLVGRQTHVDAIRERGLVIRGILGELRMRVHATSDPSEIDEADAIILATKHKDTSAALESVSHMRHKIGVALSLQNGVRKDDPLKEFFGESRVLCAITTLGASLSGPGTVNFTGAGVTYLAEYSGETTERLVRLVCAFEGAGMEARTHTDARFLLWAKVMRYLPTAMMAALTRLPQPKYLGTRAGAELNIILTREIASVARGEGVRFVDLYRLPILTLVEGDFVEAAARVMEGAHRMGEGAGADSRPSMLQDIERGRKTEIEETAGYIIAEARRLGLGVPHLDTCYRLITAVDDSLV